MKKEEFYVIAIKSPGDPKEFIGIRTEDLWHSQATDCLTVTDLEHAKVFNSEKKANEFFNLIKEHPAKIALQISDTDRYRIFKEEEYRIMKVKKVTFFYYPPFRKR